MYDVILNNGRSVRKHVDQMRSQIENSDQVDNSIEINSDTDDSLEMRVPRANKQSDSNNDAIVKSRGREPPSISTTTTDIYSRRELETTLDNVEPSLP